MATVTQAAKLSIEAINVDPGFNVRDMETEENRISLAELTESIRDNGLFTPLQGYYNAANEFVLTRGHRRLAAMKSLDWKSLVPVILDEQASTEVERTAGILLDNSGKALGPLEAAEVFLRLKRMSMTGEAIAKRCGVTAMTVSSGLKVLGVPSAVMAIKKSLTTHTEAYECIKVLEGRGEKAKGLENFFRTQVEAAKPFNRKITDEPAEPPAAYLSGKARSALLDMVTNLALDEAGASEKLGEFAIELNAFCKAFDFDPHTWYRQQQERVAEELAEDEFKEKEAIAKAEAKAAKEEEKAKIKTVKDKEKEAAVRAKAAQGNKVA